MSLRRKQVPTLSETIEFKQGVVVPDAKTPIDHIMDKLDRLENKMQPDPKEAEHQRMLAKLDELDKRTRTLSAQAPVLRAAAPDPLHAIKREVFSKIEALEKRQEQRLATARASEPARLATARAPDPPRRAQEPSRLATARAPEPTEFTQDAWVRERVRLDKLRAMG